MDDRVLAMCELSGDLLFHKIPRNRLEYYVDGSLCAGRGAAALYSGQRIQDLYRDSGIQIRYAGSGKQNYGVLLRGQSVMGKDGCSVEVYQDSIEALAASSAWDGSRLTPEEALETHLAHEFFHIWEYRNGLSITDKLEPIVSLRVLGFQRTSHIYKCGEIAAHAFAKELLGLPFLPNFYDYLYLMNTGKMTRSAFDELLRDMTARLSPDGS